MRAHDILERLKSSPHGRRVTNILEWCTALEHRYVRMRYAMLFYSLLITFVASPILGTFHVESNPLHILLALNILLALTPMRRVNVRRTLITLVVTTWIVRLLIAYLGDVFSSVLTIWTFVGLFAAANALRTVLVAKSIRSEEIYAALSAYLLAGISFGIFYWAVERAWPGSVLYGGKTPKVFSQPAGIYFSFVTLSTLGYGDYVPNSDITRGLAIVEAVAGQLYLGVMVARLISMYVAGAKQQPQAGSNKQEVESK